MTDTAIELAKYLNEEAKVLSPTKMIKAIAVRFPHISQPDLLRGIQIAREIKHADAAEYTSGADRLDREYEEKSAELARRGVSI